MVSLGKASIEPEEIVSFLKKNIRLKEVYQEIVHQKIINQAAQERGLTVTPEEIQAEADKQRREKRLEKASDTLAWLEDQIITSEDWEVGIYDHILKQKLSEHLFAQEVEKFFAKNRLNFEQILLYRISTPSEQFAQELFYQIEEQEISFYEAAHFYDTDEERRHQCGYEGKLYRWSLKPDIAAAIFSANPAEVIGPLKSEQEYQLFMVEKFIPAELTQETYKDIINNMFEEWLASELNHFLYS